MTLSTNSIRLHRFLRATPERIYRAFIDADAMAKSLPPKGFTGKVRHLDAKVGGTYRMSFTNFTTGTAILLAESILNLYRTNAFGTRTDLTTQTYPEKCRRQYP